MNLAIPGQYLAQFLFLVNDEFVPLLLAIAFLSFLWGVYKYFIYGADNEAERSKGRVFIFWGIIGFVVIMSLWGLVGVVGNTFGLSPGGALPPPVL